MIRSGIQRTSAKPAPGKGARTRKCSAKGCLHRYVPGADPRVTWCSEECSVIVAMAAGAKRAATLARAQRVADKERKEKSKRRADHVSEAQTAFNAYIRERDKDLPCICCGRFPKIEHLTGGAWDAGHYRSIGSAPHLRFHEYNCHKQMKHCNRDGAGRAVDYRIGLIARIGQDAVEALESDQAPRKWTVEELMEIKTLYRQKLKSLREL